MSTLTSSQGYNVPDWLSGAIQQNVQQGQMLGYSASPYAQVGAQGIAAFNPTQWGALGTAQGLAGYQPQQVMPGNVGAQQVSANTVAGTDLSAYMNPYTQNVVGGVRLALDDRLAQQQQTNNGLAAQSGAFGGDRAAIVNEQAAKDNNQLYASTIGNLFSQGYTQAQNTATSDANRQLQAGLANQSANLQAGTTNLNNWLQSQQLNQSAGLQGAALNLNANSQATGLGLAQQQTDQSGLNAQDQYGLSNGLWPYQGLSYADANLKSLPTQYLASQYANTPGPSTLGQIAGLGSSLLGLNGLVAGANGGTGLLGLAGQGFKSLFGGSDATSTAANGAVTTADGSTYSTDPGAYTGEGLDDSGNILSDWNFRRGGRVMPSMGLAGFAYGGEVWDDDTYAPLDYSQQPRGVADAADALPAPAYSSTQSADVADQVPSTAGLGAIPAENIRRGELIDAATQRARALIAGSDSASPIPAADAVRQTLSTVPDADKTLVSAALRATFPGMSADAPYAPPTTAAAPDAAPEAPAAASADDANLPLPPAYVSPEDAARQVRPTPSGQGVAAAVPPQAPQGIAAAPATAVPPASARGIAPAAPPSSGGLGAWSADQPMRGGQNILDQLSQGNNPFYLALIKGGAAAMASRNPTALGAIGEGLAGGVGSLEQSAQTRAVTQLKAAQQAQTAQYHNDQLALRRDSLNQNRDLKLMELNGRGYSPEGAPATGGIGGASVLGGYADKIIGVENNTGNPAARNPNSTAMGNGQFIDSTWLSLMKQAHPDVTAGKSDAQILALRADPQLSRQAVNDYAAQNAPKLQSAGLPVSDSTLALAHRFGPDGAVAVLQAPADKPVGDVVGGAVIAANPDLRGKTAGAVASQFGNRFGNALTVPGLARTQVADAMGSPGTVATDAGFASAPPQQARPTFLRNNLTQEMDTRGAPAGQAWAVDGSGRRYLANIPGARVAPIVEKTSTGVTYRDPQTLQPLGSVPDINRAAQNADLAEDRTTVGKLADSTQSAQANQTRLIQMRNLLDDLPQTGANGETRARLNAWVATYVPSAAARFESLGSAAAAQEFTKLATQNAGQQERGVLGARGGIQAINLYKDANPSLNQLPATNRAIINAQLIANQADQDYANGAISFFNQSRASYYDTQSNKPYQGLSNYDQVWNTQRNPQVYAAAMSALNGDGFNKWSSGLSPQEGARVAQIIAHVNPTASIQGRSGSYSVSAFAPRGR